MRLMWLMAVGLVAGTAAEGWGQSSSLLLGTASMPSEQLGLPSSHDAGQDEYPTMPPKGQSRPATRTLEQMSMFTIPPEEPRKFKVNDLVSIIVRQHKRYEGDAEYDKEKKWNIEGKLSEWFRFHDDIKHLGTDNLSNGQPGFAFDYDDTYETEGERDREDRFTTRIQATIIDVKPNGNLVLEATAKQQHDEEAMVVTVTGTCRSEDVTPDNTVFSTQLAELVIEERNKGAIRDAEQRGWVPRILDMTKPF